MIIIFCIFYATYDDYIGWVMYDAMIIWIYDSTNTFVDARCDGYFCVCHDT